MKNRFTRLTALLCAAAILLCSLPMQALAAEFQPQTTYEDSLPDGLPVQEEAPAATEEPEAPESAEQLEPAADASAEPEAAPEELAAAVLSTGNKSGDFTYSVLSDNTAQITGYSGSDLDLTIPAELDGYTVSSIGYEAFYRKKTLGTVNIPDDVTTIKTNAFRECTALKSIHLPAGLTTIEAGAFTSCSSLESVQIPDTVEAFGANAFGYCTSLTEVNYPKKWRYVWTSDYIGSPFRGCTKLTSITVPEGVTAIPNYAFYYSSIQRISLPSTLTTIGSEAFRGANLLQMVDIPDDVTTIKTNAFRECTALKSIHLPAGLTTIEAGAFTSCSSLESVQIPDTVEAFGANAFGYCTSLTEVNYPKKWRYVWTSDYIGSPFRGCTKLTSITVPEGVTAIPNYAFYYSSIQRISLPSTLTTIGSEAFYYCTALQSATVLSSSCRIADNAFSGCGRMTLYCPWVSNATLYAVNNGIMFQPLDASRVDYSGYLSDMSATALYTSAAAASVSSRIPVTLKYSIPQSVFEGLKKTQIVFTLSSCLELSSSIAVNGEITDAASRDGNTISIPINSNSGTIQLSVTPVQAGKAIVVASFSCTSGGSARTEIVGVLALDTPSIQLHEQSSVSTVTFDVSGICEKSKTLLLYIDDVQVGSVRAKKDGTFRTNVAFPNTPVSGTTYTLTAKYEDNTGITASIPVYYYEEAPNLTKFEMYYYGPTLKKLDLLNTDGTRLTNSIYPNHPFKFVVKFNHSEVLGRVCIASTKNGITKKMDAVFNEETDEYIAEGYFKNTDTSYIPGTINVYYTVKGDMSIHSRDLEQSELPDLWKNAAVDVMLDTGDTYCSQITLEDGQQLEFARNDSMTLEEVRDMLLPKASEQSRVQLNGTGVLDDPELEGVKSFVEDLQKTYGKNVISNAEKLATSDEEAVIAVKDNVGKRVVFVFWDSAKAAFRMASIKFLGTSFIQENSYGLSWTQSYQAYGIIADGGKNILQLTLDMVNLERAEQDIEVSTTLTKEQKEYALEKLNGVRWGYAAVSLMRWAGTICNYAFTASGNPMLGVAVSFILNMAANLAENYLDGSLAYYAAGGRGSYLRWLIDPSGYVYDAETGERLAGVTVTAYWIEYDEEKGADESFWENTPANTTEGIKWDASEHSQQNSLITDESGCYAWEVPAGWWRVKYELAGYETAWSDWLPVPPPQLDVNIGLKPLAPEYTVRAETVTAERVSVRVTSSSEAKQTARCVLAAYDTDGRLTATAVQTLSPGSAAVLMLSGLTAGSTVKLFILNSTTGEPLRRSWSSALQAA